MKLVTVVFVAMLLLGTASTCQAASVVESVQFYSESLEENRWLKVYLPDGYDPGGPTSYPVVYFLHGFTDLYYNAYWQYVGLQAILDNLITSNTIDPIILVTIDGRILDPPWIGSWWTTSELYGRFEDYVTDDVVEFIDWNYRTIPAPAFRVLMGHSMGGYGAIKIALKNQDSYRAVVSSSGVPDVWMFQELYVGLIISECPEPGPPYSYAPANGFETLVGFSRCGAFSPNLGNPPHYVDFFLDENGHARQSVLDRWRLEESSYLASIETQNPAMAVYLECGNSQGDLEHQIHQMNCAFADSLDNLGWDYQFRVYDGLDHFFSCSTRFPDDFAVIDSLLQSSAAIVDAGVGRLPEDRVLLLSPNPAFEATDVTFAVPANGWANLAVYDLQGRLIRRLVQDKVTAGQHRCRWSGLDENGDRVPRGVYFLRLSAENGVSARERVVMVR